ncbi:MAG TPA: tetratricopeptide repeat protein [Candidatus Angelobacter sp.]
MDELETPRRLRLDSWKEIAAYLRKDIRTVQLWEKKEGLPVHRHAHTARATVYAYPGELDAWLAERQQKSPASSDAETALNEPAEVKRRRNPLYVVLPIGLLVALLVGAAVLYRHRMSEAPFPAPKPPANTIAVLPFEDLSPQRHDDHLADGLTDDIVVALGRTGQLPVISRRSSARFKASQEPLPQIADSLHANFILEGTFVRAGRRVRITADLVDASSDRHLWTQSYERNLADVLSMQDEVAASIASSVTERMTGRPPGIQATSRPVNPEARTAYLTGRFFWNKRDEPGLKKAIEYFNQASAKDPQSAPAYSGLADCYTLLSVWGSLSSRESFPKAKAAALKALELDPASAEAYTSLAVVTARWDWNFSAAEQYFKKAIQINPNYAVAHQWYGEFLGDLGRADQSIAESEKAVQLDPLSPMAGCDLSVTYIHARQPENAVKALQRVLSFAPDFQPAHLYLAAAYQGTGQIDKAEEEARRHAQLTGDNTFLVMLRIGRDAAEGRTQQAKQAVEELLQRSRESQFGAYNAAGLYFTIGDKEAGYRELERAYREHSWFLVNLPVDQDFDSVRQEPRFRDLMRRVGLPGN